MSGASVRIALGAILVCAIYAEILTPPYFNLATGRNITATATCGEDTDEPELYCKLVGANAENYVNVNIIQGQLCDYCDPTRPDKRHPPEYAVDGLETWWQSPPLSRGATYNEVNLTIDLGQEFHVAYVYIRMGNSPRPGLWILEKSVDYGKTYTPWQYFSDSKADCEAHFGSDSLLSITRDDSVICTTEYSKILPLEGGEIPISILNNRPSANHYFNSSILQEWTRATNIRFHFKRTKNLLGHLMFVARQDPTVTRRYFYSIKDISIGGRCMCNGHADTCDVQDPTHTTVLLCRCQHNTCGAKCDTCCRGFQQKAWKQSKYNKPFICEPCNCFQHSNECVYDAEVDKQHLSLDIHGNYEGGGVCQNCQHNTEGYNCNRCKATYYRPNNKFWNETDVCQPCECNYFYSTGNCEEITGKCECRKEYNPPNCDSCSFGYYDYPNCKPCQCFINGTENLQCEASNGTCECKYNYGGDYCAECASEYYSFPNCTSCECNPLGSISRTCDQETGNCSCKNNYGGKQCGECQNGYYSYPSCTYCNCDAVGTVPDICDKNSGKCLCKKGYSGERCDECIPGYYGYPNCKSCNCSLLGSVSPNCDRMGNCPCLENFGGRTCEKCSPGYFKYPECIACNCDGRGSEGISCDNEGHCQCHYNFDGDRCEICKEGFYNFPICEECNCNPAGVIASFGGCGSVPAGELCQCKERVEGRICNKCKPLFWNLHLNNPQGCEDCLCNPSGVVSGIEVCDNENGQCACKPSVVSRRCSDCVDGTYNLRSDNIFGCTDCGCDIGGSVSSVCDKKTGKCQCHLRIMGRSCNEPLQAHYFPTLYQYQYEVEDGFTPANTAVRYAYDEQVFSNFSWRGYAVFSPLQKEILQNIFIGKPSIYRMVIRYVNLNSFTVNGKIKIIPESSQENEQSVAVIFKPSLEPTFVTISGAGVALVLNPGRWIISIETQQSLFVDYFVLLPENFYLATILNQKVQQPCVIGDNKLCRDYSYPSLSSFDMSWGSGGYIKFESGFMSLAEYYDNVEHLQQLNISNRIPLLNDAQPELSYNITIRKPGRYVIIINYITPLNDHYSNDIIINAVAQNGRSTSKAVFNACPYTTVCRQVVTDKQNKVGIHLVDGNLINIQLQGTNSSIGIYSIVAIPIEDWSLDYIKPKPICIFKDGVCASSTFPNPPESKKVQFKQGITDTSPTNRSYSYVYLNSENDMIDLRAKVASSGSYIFVVHYYQPEFAKFDLNVIVQNGKFYEAKLPIEHCPSKSGCRSLVVENGGNINFLLVENFMITLKELNNKGVYLDYLLIIPSDIYVPNVLDEENFDRTGEFISTCGNNHFNIDITKPGFCRDSVVSITASHNNGALKCECDFDGSLSFTCDKYGGQCSCKDNVIGRQCEACKTGFYDFPNCKPCNCPSTALCETSTGRCICPKHVIGELCDQCEPYTYGYDQIIGCEECNCNSLGVEHDLHCDLLNGSCKCKQNIIGRTCDTCNAGYFSFPYCESCECDLRGTIEEVCDKVSAECLCKKFVTGTSCNFCKEGSFNLQKNNEEGCTECFCFGKTNRCVSSSYVQIPLSIMDDWKLVAINESETLQLIPLNISIDIVEQYTTIGADFSKDNVSNIVVYFSAPSAYLGHKLSSYGGYLNYSIFYTIGLAGKAVPGSDIILEGAGTYLKYESYEQPASAIEYPASLQLVESNFQLPSGFKAKREHIMVVLQNLKGLYIRATYWTASVTSKLLFVYMDDAIPPEYNRTNGHAIATSVEQCYCPPGYEGLSCENCAPGYYRISSGPHGGFCIPCQCNGHATECDVNTGICLDCKHNTKGEHCELCAVGYHGNALQGTPGDCLICACPLPVTSNNFATACDLTADGEKISCECTEGYIGARCQSCAAGYYGRPENVGDYCKPCQCSGNINPIEIGSCDTQTGECLRCLNNTFGEACALCAPGFYGDAIQAKNCQACICDQLGTQHCNSYTGKCECKPNVIGEKCDRCELEHYGFNSGYGCTPCNCGTASLSSQCDDSSGQCRCKPGVGSRACDVCSPGFWKYSSEGCESCGCKSEYSLGFGCNSQTGHCECLPGVVGEKCDQCPHRWAFIPDVGCHQCDKCIDNLLDVTDELEHSLNPYLLEFDSVDSGYLTMRRLTHFNSTLNELRPKVNQLDHSIFDLVPIITQLQILQQRTEAMNNKANYSIETGKKLDLNSENAREESLSILDSIREAAERAYDAIANIEYLSETLVSGEGPKIDAALQEAEYTLNAMNIYNLTTRENDANNQLKRARDLLERIAVLQKPVYNISSTFNNLKTNLKEFDNRMVDLYNQTHYSLSRAKEVDTFLAKNGKDKVSDKLKNVINQNQEIGNNLKDTESNLNNATQYLKDAQLKYENVSNDHQYLELENKNFNNSLETNMKEIDIIENLLPLVKDHAANLSQNAQELDNLLSESRNISVNAVKAATAYKNIVDAVDEADNAAQSATTNVNDASKLLTEVDDETNNSGKLSENLLIEANIVFENTSEALKPNIEGAIAKSRPVRALHQKNDEILKTIENYFQQPHKDASLYNNLKNVLDSLDKVNNSDKVLQLFSDNFKNLTSEKEASQHLPNEVEDAQGEIFQAKQQIININEDLPKIEQALKELPSGQERVRILSTSLKEKIKILNQQVALARDVANRIKVGVKFYRNTTLELRNPDNFADLSTSTHISGYFKTKEPNGLLLYLGNGKGTNLRRTTTDDYMALEVENGYLVLTLDVGNGPQRIVNIKFVSDDNWYQFIIDRTAHNSKLIVREEVSPGRDMQHIASEELTGHNTIFNLDKNQSKLFIGGYPPQFPMQNQVRQMSFDGEIEDLVIGDIPISLWNFNDGNENNHGAIKRNKLVNLQPSTGYRFNGNGYAIVDARSYSLKTQSDIKLSFKTSSPDGLLFLVKGDNNNKFISLELRDGRVLYQYNLGDETKIWLTSNIYNDGQWHTIEASRESAKGRLIVDDKDIPDSSPPISGSNIGSFETFFFGGFPQSHSISGVTNVDFDGCIDNVVVMSYPIDLSQNVKAYGVTPGCPEKFARLLSFSSNNTGYIKSNNFSSGTLFQMNIKFKTKSKEGLIFFATDQFGNNGVSLSILDGKLILISQKIQLETSDSNYHDNEWHVVSIVHNETTLRLDVDDYAHKVTDSPPPSMLVMYGEIYFGGVPLNLNKNAMLVTTKPFSGCIVDASKNGAIVNFASFEEKNNVILGKCVLDELIGSETNVHVVPTLPPIHEIEFITTPKPDIKTVEPYEAGIPQRGDGGRENAGFKLPSTTTTTTTTTTKVTTLATVTEKIIEKQTQKPYKTKPVVYSKSQNTRAACALPMVPNIDISAPTTSYKYGLQTFSRSEYLLRGKVRKQFNFTLEFKTSLPEGILLYITSLKDQQYVALFLKDGHIIFEFNGGSGAATIKSLSTYNDNNWHHVNISRIGPDGKLIIDHQTAVEGRTPKNTASIQLNGPVYVGSVPKERYNQVKEILNISSTFHGCIREFNMNGFVMNDATEHVETMPCLDNIERGTFFGIKGGYIKLKERYKVGFEIDIRLEIKPRNISGLLVAVHGRKDYLVLEMVEGAIRLTADNGKGGISSTFQPEKQHSLCDGQWHHIQAVKSKNVVSLSVDSTFTLPGIGDNRSLSTDTVGALFLGGHRLINKARGIATRTSFVGCIRNVKINNDHIPLTQQMAEGNIFVGTCPAI